jgi:uncharacterized protein (DUF433 family)
MIVKDENISFGQPTIKGRRLTVHDIVTGISTDGLKGYSDDQQLSIEECKEAIVYCMNLKCQEQAGKFCDGCILSTINNGWSFDKDDFELRKIDNDYFLVDRATGSIYLGDKQEYENHLFGDIGWGIAQEIHEKYFDKLSD